MDHFAGNVQRRLTGDELDTPPAVGPHALAVVAREPHAAVHIDLEHLFPVGVTDLEEFPRAVNAAIVDQYVGLGRSDEHTSELQSLMRISYDVFCLKKKKHKHI